MGQLEELRRELDELQAMRKAVAAFGERYRRYAQVASRRRARVLRQAQTAFDDVSRDLSAAEQTLEQARAAVEKWRAEADRLDEQLAADAERLSVLETHPTMQDARRIADARRRAADCRSSAGEVQAGLDTARSRLAQEAEAAEHRRSGSPASGKDPKETQMILNHKAAIELLVGSAEEIGVNRFTLRNLHALLADNLLDDPRTAGRLRESPIAIGASTYLPTAIPQLIESQFTALLNKASAIENPFEQSFFLMVQLPYLQPFVDVNKRVSRLVANISLIKSNLIPLSFIDVPVKVYTDGLIGVYELNRVEFLRDVFALFRTRRLLNASVFQPSS